VGKTILIPAFGKMALADITDAAITRLYKSMRTRKPPYSQATIRMAHVVLSALLNASEEAGEPFRFESMRRLYRGIFPAAELPEKFRLKTSRHSCASALINEPDAPLKAISAMLGHTSIRTTADI
jgi:integrase